MTAGAPVRMSHVRRHISAGGRTGMSNAPTILFSDADASFGQLGPTFFIVWKERTLATTVERMRETMLRRMRAIEGRIGILIVVAPDAPMPDAAARQGIAKLFADLGDRLAGSALAYEGEGFRAAAVRGVVTGIALLVRRPFPHRIFESARSGAEWLAGELAKGGAEVAPSELVACTELVRNASPTAFA